MLNLLETPSTLTIVWFALVGLITALCWPFIQNGWLGPWWSLGILAAGIVGSLWKTRNADAQA